jgi:hypothetical protein
MLQCFLKSDDMLNTPSEHEETSSNSKHILEEIYLQQWYCIYIRNFVITIALQKWNTTLLLMSFETMILDLNVPSSWFHLGCLDEVNAAADFLSIKLITEVMHLGELNHTLPVLMQYVLPF